MPSHREAFILHAAQALQEAETRLPRDVTRALANEQRLSRTNGSKNHRRDP